MNRIALGTVQFGMQYGVSNNNGQTTQDQVREILKLAKKNDIRTLDTAALYGESESVIGLSTENSYDWKIVTKTPQFVDKSINAIHIKQLEKSFKQSLLNLNKRSVYGLLLHSCDDLLKHNGELIFKSMEELKSAGLVKKIGVSVYNSKQLDAILEKFNVDIVQLPINIFDQHFFLGGWLKRLKDNNIEIHARSVFLQGLLLMSPDSLPPYFSPIKEKMVKFSKMASNFSLSKLELALSYVMSIHEIDQVVIGINNLQHLHEIINAASIRVSTSDFSNLLIDDPAFINPTNWKI
jgi:aryl-alcohol dehydrogenase-like predicted oxidoreductase